MQKKTFIVKGRNVWVIDIKPLEVDELQRLGLAEDEEKIIRLLWQQYKDNQDFRAFALDLMDFLEPHLSLAEKKEMLVQLTNQLIKYCPIDEGLSVKTAVDRLGRFIDDAQKYDADLKHQVELKRQKEKQDEKDRRDKSS